MSRNIHAELPTTHPYSLFPHPAGAPSMRQTTPLPPPPSGLKADAGERAAGYKYAQGTAANSLPCHPLGGDRVGWLLGRSQGCPAPWGTGGSGASKRLLHFFFALFKGKEQLPLYFSWTFAHLLRGRVPVLPGPWLGAQNERAQGHLLCVMVQARPIYSQQNPGLSVHSTGISRGPTEGQTQCLSIPARAIVHTCSGPHCHVFIPAPALARDSLALTWQLHQEE